MTRSNPLGADRHLTTRIRPTFSREVRVNHCDCVGPRTSCSSYFMCQINNLMMTKI